MNKHELPSENPIETKIPQASTSEVAAEGEANILPEYQEEYRKLQERIDKLVPVVEEMRANLETLKNTDPEVYQRLLKLDKTREIAAGIAGMAIPVAVLFPLFAPLLALMGIPAAVVFGVKSVERRQLLSEYPELEGADQKEKFEKNIAQLEEYLNDSRELVTATLEEGGAEWKTVGKRKNKHEELRATDEQIETARQEMVQSLEKEIKERVG